MITVLFMSIFCFILIHHLFYWETGYPGDTKNQPIQYFAHRGYKGSGCPENSLEAFGEAIKNGFHWIEVDVLSTIDDVIVCTHNYDLEAETNGVGDVNKKHYKSIHALNIGIYNNNKYRHGLPTLEDVLKLTRGKIGINIEIKAHKVFEFKTARALSRTLLKRPRAQMIISSFNPFVILYFRIFHRNIMTAFLFESVGYYWFTHIIHPNFIHPRIDILNKKMIDDSNAHNFGINVWTADNYPCHKYLEKLDINGIITDMDLKS